MGEGAPLRILHLTAGSDAGGLSRYIADMCRAMHDRGHWVAVAGERGFSHDLFEHAPWPWIDVPLKGSPIALRGAVGTLREFIATHGIDLIHTHYRRPTLVARRLQRTFNVPILYTVHQPRIAMGWLRRRLTDFGDHTHVASQDARQWLIETCGLSDSYISVIPHGIDPAKFPQRDETTKQAARRLLNLPDNKIIAAFVGRFDTPKNPHWIIDAAIEAREQNAPMIFVMMGHGPDEADLRGIVQREKLDDMIRILPYGDPLPLYQAADALLIPSLREGFSLVCAEAMAVGIPVFRTQTGGSMEMVIEGETGKTVPVDPGAFSRGAVEFLRDEDALRRMGIAAAAHVRRHFTFDRQYENALALYRLLIEQFKPGSTSHGSVEAAAPVV